MGITPAKSHARTTIGIMIRLKKTNIFEDWLAGLRDRRAKFAILVRIERLSLGNPGDVSPVGEGVSELKIDYGPGYRVYFKRRGSEIIILLCGGSKKGQSKDIENAKSIAREWSDENDKY